MHGGQPCEIDLCQAGHHVASGGFVGRDAARPLTISPPAPVLTIGSPERTGHADSGKRDGAFRPKFMNQSERSASKENPVAGDEPDDTEWVLRAREGDAAAYDVLV